MFHGAERRASLKKARHGRGCLWAFRKTSGRLGVLREWSNVCIYTLLCCEGETNDDQVGWNTGVGGNNQYFHYISRLLLLVLPTTSSTLCLLCHIDFCEADSS